MKKMICIVLILLMIAGSAALSLTASAESADRNDVLIVTANGKNPTEIKVGTEFIIRIGLNAGSAKIINGQVEMTYDPEYLSFVPYEGGVYDDMDSYCFPLSIYSSGLICNTQNPGLINYNFSRITGVAVFNDTSKLFTRFRFKAKAPGTTDITHFIENMKDLNDRIIYYLSKPSAEVAPYTEITFEPSVGCIGDADGDRVVTVMDATQMQLCAAGADTSCDIGMADVTSDGVVSLKDAVIVRRFVAGKKVSYPVGTGLYASEMQ